MNNIKNAAANLFKALLSRCKRFFLALPKNTFEFFKRHINTVYAVISIILVLLMLSVVGARAKIDKEDILLVDVKTHSSQNHYYYYYDVVTNEHGSVIYTPSCPTPFLFLHPTTGETEFNTVTIHFGNDIEASSFPVYYSFEGEELNNSQMTWATVTADRRSAVVSLPLSQYTDIRFDLNAVFILEGFTVQRTTQNGIEHPFNVATFIALIVILLILVGVEKWFGYFKALGRLFARAYSSAKELLVSKAYCRFAVRLLLTLCALVFAFSSLFLLISAKMSIGAIAFIFFLGVALIALFIWDRIMNGKVSVSKTFLVCTLIFGFMLCLLLPLPSSVSWDEQIHYYQVVDVSDWLFGLDITAVDNAQKNITVGFAQYMADPQGMIEKLFVLDQSSVTWKSSIKNGSLSVLYNKLGYIPAAFMMSLSDALGINYFAMIVLSSFAQIALYAFVCYAGIKRLKSGKYLFSAIALIPVSLFICANYSYDYFVTAFILYSYAYFVSELQRPDKPFTVRDGILMLGSIFLGCGPKAVYAVLIFPMLFMSKSKFGSKKSRIIYVLCCILVFLLIVSTFILPFFSGGVSDGGDYRGGSDVSTKGQVEFIFSNPLKYTKILLNFIGEYLSLSLANESIAFYAYLDGPHMFVGALTVIVIFFCAFTDKSKYDDIKHSTLHKLAAFFTVFCQACLIATALYISFTPVGHYTVNGCQWRYLIPALPMLLYSMGSVKIRHEISERFMAGFVFGSMMLLNTVTLFEAYISKLI